MIFGTHFEKKIGALYKKYKVRYIKLEGNSDKYGVWPDFVVHPLFNRPFYLEAKTVQRGDIKPKMNSLLRTGQRVDFPQLASNNNILLYVLVWYIAEKKYVLYELTHGYLSTYNEREGLEKVLLPLSGVNDENIKVK